MAKQGMSRPDRTHTQPRNEAAPVPELQGKAKHTKKKANPIVPGTSGPSGGRALSYRTAAGITAQYPGRSFVLPITAYRPPCPILQSVVPVPCLPVRRGGLRFVPRRAGAAGTPLSYMAVFPHLWYVSVQ